MNKLIAVRWAFTNPIEWRAANELVRRGKYKRLLNVRHFLWEFIVIVPTEKRNAQALST